MNAPVPASLLIVIPSLQGGGAERVVTTLVRHLDRTRFSPAIALLDGRHAVFATDIPTDVPVIDLGTRRVRHSLPALVRLIRSRQPDVVMSVIGVLNIGLALVRPLLPARTRLVARETVPVREVPRSPLERLAWRVAYRRLYPRFDRVICQSEAMRSELELEFGLPDDRAVVIPNPVDIVRIQALAATTATEAAGYGEWESSGAIRLVAAGRLSHEKGFDLLLRALAQLRDARFQLVLLGDGPLRAELEALARELGIGARVHFAGFVQNPYAVFARAHAFVLSSRFEGFPNAVLEALASGTPVIATPAIGGIKEMISGRTGCVLTDAVSVPALADALARLAASAMVRAAAPVEYAAAGIAARYADAFADALAGAAA